MVRRRIVAGWIRSFAPGLLLLAAAGAQPAANQAQPSASATALPMLTLASAPPIAGYGQPVAFVATALLGGSAATGSIVFFDTFQGATSALAEVALDARGTASLTAFTLAVGVHSIVACYDNSGGSNPPASCPTGDVTSPLPQTVLESTATTLQSSQNPSALGSGVTFIATVAVSDGGGATPDGSVTFSNGENTLCASMALSGGIATCAALPAQLIAGNNFITATYSGDAGKQILGSSSSLQQDMQSSSSVSVSSQPNPSTFGAAVNFTVTITTSGPAAPTGSVEILDGGQKIGMIALPGSANQASFSTTALAVGSHSITAVYNGDVNYAASPPSSAEIQVVQAVQPPPAADFSLTVTPASVTLQSGKSATASVSLAPLNGFSGIVALACAGLPGGVSCRFSRASVSLSGSAAQTVQLTIANASAAATVSGWTLPFGVLGCLFWRRRKTALRSVLVLLLSLSAALAMGGCGAATVTGSALLGSHTIQVTATSGNIAHAQNIAVMITP